LDEVNNCQKQPGSRLVMAYFVGLFAYAELDYRTYFEAFSFVREFCPDINK